MTREEREGALARVGKLLMHPYSLVDWTVEATALEETIEENRRLRDALEALHVLLDFEEKLTPQVVMTVDNPAAMNEAFATAYELLRGEKPMWKALEA